MLCWKVVEINVSTGGPAGPPWEVGLGGVPKFFTLKVLQNTFIESLFTSWVMFTLNVPFYMMS